MKKIVSASLALACSIYCTSCSSFVDDLDTINSDASEEGTMYNDNFQNGGDMDVYGDDTFNQNSPPLYLPEDSE